MAVHVPHDVTTIFASGQLKGGGEMYDVDFDHQFIEKQMVLMESGHVACTMAILVPW